MKGENYIDGILNDKNNFNFHIIDCNFGKDDLVVQESNF